MGMTMTQKILAAHAGLEQVKAGQLINVRLDMVLGNDITTPVAVYEFNKAGFTGVLTATRYPSCSTTLSPTRISRQPNRLKPAAALPENMILKTFLT